MFLLFEKSINPEMCLAKMCHVAVTKKSCRCNVLLYCLRKSKISEVHWNSIEYKCHDILQYFHSKLNVTVGQTRNESPRCNGDVMFMSRGCHVHVTSRHVTVMIKNVMVLVNSLVWLAKNYLQVRSIAYLTCSKIFVIL